MTREWGFTMEEGQDNSEHDEGAAKGKRHRNIADRLVNYPQREKKRLRASEEAEHGPSDEGDKGLEGLTLYEKNRIPLKKIDEENHTTTIRLRTLNQELTCPICLGIIHQCRCVMECLHRFCASCISKSLRLGKRECPTCRMHVSSQRHLRPDPRIDRLIETLYPNLEEYEQQQESLIKQLNVSFNRDALREGVKEGIARQQRAKTKRVEKPKKTSRQRARQQTQSLHQPMTNRKTYKIKVPKAQDKKGKGMYKKSIANTSASSESTTVPASQQPLYEPRLWNDGVYYYKHPRHNTDAKREDSPPPPKELAIRLEPHPMKADAPLPMPHVTISKQAPLEVLAKVVALQRKLQYNEGLVQFSLMLEKNSPETCLELAPSTSLAQIKEDYWYHRQDLTLFYAINPNGPKDRGEVQAGIASTHQTIETHPGGSIQEPHASADTAEAGLEVAPAEKTEIELQESTLSHTRDSEAEVASMNMEQGIDTGKDTSMNGVSSAMGAGEATAVEQA